MQILLIALDGLGDRPVSRGKTPLQLAKKPNMDRLAKGGISGISYPIGPGIVPGSDTGYLSLFGYDPYHFYVGRGILEALGSGAKVHEGDIAFRANFSTVDGKMNIIDRRAGRIDGKDADELAKSISKIIVKDRRGKDITFQFEHVHGHRCVLLIRGQDLSPMVSDTDMHVVGQVAWAKAINPSDDAKRTADALNEWLKKANAILKSHSTNKRRKERGLPEANFIITRGASMLTKGVPYKGASYSGIYGEAVSITPFKEKYKMDATCVASGFLYKGVARYIGMDVMSIDRKVGALHADLDEKVKAALSELKKGTDFVFLHFKGTDVAGHDGDWKAKVKFIEKADKAIAPFLKLKDTIIVVTSDHSTPCALKAHSADPVPILIHGPAGMIRPDHIAKFDEVSASHGGLDTLRHADVMPILLGLLGKAKMFGT